MNSQNMKKNPHKQFPGKMDKTSKRKYKTTYRMGYGKLKHVRLFENFDQVDETFDEEERESIKEVIKKNSFMSLRDPLENLGFEVDFQTYDPPMPAAIYNVTKKDDSQRIVILNKEYADDPDFVHGEIAMGVMESIRVGGKLVPLNEKVSAEITIKTKIKKSILEKIVLMSKLMDEHKALKPILEQMEKKSKDIEILKSELIPELQKYKAQFFKIDKFLVEIEESIKAKGEKTTYSYKNITDDLSDISEKMKQLVEDTKELHKTVHPAEVITKYDLKVSKVDEGVVNWIKDVFGTLAEKFNSIWSKITSNVDGLEKGIDSLAGKLGLDVPTTEEAIKQMN